LPATCAMLTMVSSVEQVMCTSLKVEYLHNRSADSSKSHIKMMLVIVATNNTSLCECCMHRVKIICWYMFTNVLCGDFSGLTFSFMSTPRLPVQPFHF
jgi:hypothetical protein